MLKLKTVAWNICLIFILAVSARSYQDPIEGYWEGALVRDGSVRIIRIEFIKDGAGYRSHIESPDLLAFTLQPVAVKYEAPNLSFTLALTGRAPRKGRVMFQGEARMALDSQTGEMTGTVGNFTPLITIHLKRSVKPVEIPIKKEEVQFSSGDVTLAGTLITPATAGPHPVVIWIHGSVTNLRKESPLTRLLAQRGVASLVYDKRGSGKSTGDLDKATIDDLTNDALAAVRFLSKRRDISRKQIGLHGDSSGAWTAYMAAIRSEVPVAFVITTSGTAESTADQHIHTFQYFMRAGGIKFTAEELALIDEYFRLKLNLAFKGEGEEQYRAFLNRIKGSKLGILLIRPEQQDREGIDWLRRNQCDPVPYLKKLKVPFLAFYGSKDNTVPPEENVRKLESHLAEAGNRDFKIVIIPGVDHELTFGNSLLVAQAEQVAPGEHSNKYRWVWERGSTEYIEMMLDWLLKHVGVTR